MVNIQNIICRYEREVTRWIRENFKELGYDKIIEENDRKVPDFVMIRNGKKVRVEIEIYSNYFVKHKHNPEDVDEVLCLIDDVKLPVKTIQIKQLKLWYHLDVDDLVDFFKQSPDAILINHKTGQTVDHIQEEWLNISKEREVQIRKNLKDEIKFRGRLH